MTENKGELRLCAEGQRLYDEYCRMSEDTIYTDEQMFDAWDLYYEHRMECDECGYV